MMDREYLAMAKSSAGQAMLKIDKRDMQQATVHAQVATARAMIAVAEQLQKLNRTIDCLSNGGDEVLVRMMGCEGPIY